jgi:hypothetical protein
VSTDYIAENFYNEDQFAALVKKTKRTTRGWRQQRIGPPWVRPARDLILYTKKTTHTWLEEGMVLPQGRGVK